MLKRFGDVLEAGQNQIGRRAWWNRHFGGKPCDGVTCAFGAGFPNPNVVATIGIQGGSNIPTNEAMRGPSSSFVGLFVGDHAASGGSERGTIVVERSIDLCPSRELGVDARATEQVESNLSLGD